MMLILVQENLIKSKIPKNIKIREALDKNDITNILNSCSDIITRETVEQIKNG